MSVYENSKYCIRVYGFWDYSHWNAWVSEASEPNPEQLADLVARDGQATLRPQGWTYLELLLDCVVWTSTVLADRPRLLEIGGFDAQRCIGEDYDLLLHPQSKWRAVLCLNDRGALIERALDRWGFTGPNGCQADVRAVHRSLARSSGRDWTLLLKLYCPGGWVRGRSSR